MRSLRRKPKAEGVAEDLVRRIKAGGLVPGEQLPSHKQLGAAYGVSQGVITDAVQALVAQGIVRTRRRSGSFVCKRPEGGLFFGETPPGDAPGPFDRYLEPRPGETDVLKLYVSEMYRSNLDIWAEALAGFLDAGNGPSVKLSSCTDGHLEEVSDNVDLVQTTPAILRRIGGDKWSGVDDLSLLGMTEGDLLPVVTDWCANGKLLDGVPFSLTVHYLFANLDLLAEAGVSCSRPRSWEEVFSRAAAVEAHACAVAGHDGSVSVGESMPRGLLVSGLSDWLILAGAVRPHGDKIALSLERTGKLFNAYAAHPFSPVRGGDVMDRFGRGQAAFLHHCSWATVPLRDVSFSMAVWALPAAAGVRIPGRLSVMAVRRQTACLQTGLQLMKHLSSAPVQTAFARLHGNVPIRKDAAWDEGALSGHPVDPESYREALAYTTLDWSEERLVQLRQCADLAGPLASGSIRVEEAVCRFRFALRMAFQDSLEVS